MSLLCDPTQAADLIEIPFSSAQNLTSFYVLCLFLLLKLRSFFLFYIFLKANSNPVLICDR